MNKVVLFQVSYHSNYIQYQSDHQYWESQEHADAYRPGLKAVNKEQQHTKKPYYTQNHGSSDEPVNTSYSFHLVLT